MKTVPQNQQKLPSSSRYIFGFRVIAIVETVFFLCLLTIPEYYLGDGTRFISYAPHPFWIILLLIIFQYGTHEAVLCAVLCSAFLLTYNLPEPNLNDDIYDYISKISLRPFLWTVTAVVLGEFRLKQLQERADLKREIADASIREQSIASAYQKVKATKESLEVQIVGQLKNYLTSYDALKAIEGRDPIDVLVGIKDAIHPLINAEKFSVYALGENGLEIVTAFGWETDEGFSRRFFNTSDLFWEVVGKKRIVCSVNEKDLQVLGTEGIIAGPLINPSDRTVFGMLKVEGIDFMCLTLSSIETFHILCNLIGSTYEYAIECQGIRLDGIHNFDLNQYSYQYFQHQKKHYSQLVKETDFDCSLLIVKIKNARTMSLIKRKQLIIKLFALLKKNLPVTSILCEGRRKTSEVIVILPGTEMQKIKKIQIEIKKEIIKQGIDKEEEQIQLEISKIS